MPHKLIFTPQAAHDIDQIEAHIAFKESPHVADEYIERLYFRCARIALAPHQGQLQRNRRPGLRITGFERRVSIAFYLRQETVVIVSIAYGGRMHRASRLKSP